MNKPLITFIIGTRPEAIKLAPLIIRFKACKKIKTRILLTRTAYLYGFAGAENI